MVPKGQFKGANPSLTVTDSRALHISGKMQISRSPIPDPPERRSRQLADEVLSSIEEKKTTKEIWDHLTKLYEVISLHNKIFLKRKLYTLRMPESTSMTEHLNTLNTLFSQLTSLRYTIGEQERVELLLQSLPDSYDQLIINLTNSNVTSLVFDDVAAAVLQEENRRKNKEDRQVNLLQAETLTKMRGRSTERGQSSSHKHGNTANTADDRDALCCEASTTVEGRKRFTDIWLIDSGATYHMISRREWFHHYEPVLGGSVYSCNDHSLEIVGVGTIKLKIKIETHKGIMKVFHEALVVLKGEKIATNLYMLKGETLLEAEASVALCSSDSAMLWHRKLGHMSEQGMNILTLCEHCVTKRCLTWTERYKIAQGLAYSLHYLHFECEPCVLHRDIKASNVLLDSDLIAKLGDIGLARIVSHEKALQSTKIGGTFGCMALEYALTDRASQQADVYNFGIVILGIVSGRKSILPNVDEDRIYTVEWLWGLYARGKLIEAADPRLEGKYDEQQMERLMILGLYCAHPPALRFPAFDETILWWHRCFEENLESEEKFKQ
ncbi:hypothetical protein F3Y22_tig00110597pilonHSYRG00393 [Hibiscus syriacus]|uniref:Protein kinase domain-containing protein n=1 Tax=Hibiscus syriacus TaxID=106335 RepID=A0A6A3A2P2_HIBSY|nr:hypothetical protein F3Y22_tig00110597pilonHSYRG00393 [Hibiscus syriacus]